MAAIALTLSLGSSSARSQQPGSTLPPTQPTANFLPAPIAAGSVPATNKPHRAQVIFTGGMLEVRADDSSLLQILHDISRKTGMTVDGGVADQHIFGNYGPAAPATVLATLLDGTGTNMLLRESTNDTPEQLVLTQRNGGPTPPNPNAAGFDDAPPDEQGPPIPPGQPPPAIGFRGRAQQLQNFNQQPPQNSSQPPQPATAGYPPANQPPSTITQGPQPIAQPANNPLGNPANRTPSASDLNTTNSVPIDSVPTPSTAVPAPQGIVDTPNPPPAGSTANANGTTTTPEQIYQELLQLQQAKAAAAAQQPASSTTTPTPPAPTPTPSPAEAPQ